MIFLDNASTTRVFDLAVERMNKIYLEDYYNPSATYKGGRDALSYITQAREKVAKLINCQSKEVIFTSGTTQSLNLVALGYAKKDISKVVKKLDLSLDEAALVKQALLLLMK